MNILITILLVLGALIALIFIIALFVPKKYAIKRQVVINRPRQEVFDYIRFLKNQEQYSKWVMTDPSMKKGYRGQDGTVGFIYAWEGNKKAGKGEQEIIGITENERIDIEIRFVKPFESTAVTPMITERITETQTMVTWGMEAESKYPFNLMSLFMGSVLGKDLETSLANLKHKLEKRSSVNAY